MNRIRDRWLAKSTQKHRKLRIRRIGYPPISRGAPVGNHPSVFSSSIRKIPSRLHITSYFEIYTKLCLKVECHL